MNEEIPEINKPRNYIMEIALSIGLIFGAVTFALQVKDQGQIDNITYALAAATAVAGFGSAYAGGILAVFAVPGLLRMGNKQQVEPAPEQPPGRPIIHLPAEEPEEEEEGPAPPELTVFEKRTLDDRRFRGPRGQVYETDGPAVMGILVQISRARAAGRLETVSPSQLTELGIISRHATNPPNAETIIGDLEAWGFIQAGGERRPYQWTESGRHLFPSPNNTREPRPASGVLSATAATAATEVSRA